MKKTKRLIAAILATSIAATLTGCNPPEDESSLGAVSDTSSEVSTTESTESTESMVEPGVIVSEPATTTERKPKDEKHDIYGHEMTGGWAITPTGVYWKEGPIFYKSREDAQYHRNPVPQGEVDGADPN